MPIVSLLLEKITVDDEIQPRAKLIESAVEELTQLYREKVEVDPPVVFEDAQHYWLSHGFHRVAGATKAGYRTMAVDVRKGTKRDAILFACGTNDKHGTKRTNADKRRVVEKLLNDKEWGQRAVNWIADSCRVSRVMVETVKQELVQKAFGVRSTPDGVDVKQQVVRKEGKDGKSRPSTKPGVKGGIKSVIEPPAAREPGDDTDEIEAEKKANALAKRNNGKDYGVLRKKVETAFGQLNRALAKTPWELRCAQHLNAILEIVKG